MPIAKKMKFKYIKNGNTFRYFGGEEAIEIKKELLHLENEIHNFLSHTDKYKNSYFWNDMGNLAKRAILCDKARYEYESDYRTLELTLTLDFSVSASRRNLYIDKVITVNDTVCTARVLSTIVKEIDYILSAWLQNDMVAA
jgi:hypothetical protein